MAFPRPVAVCTFSANPSHQAVDFGAPAGIYFEAASVDVSTPLICWKMTRVAVDRFKV